MLPVNVVTTVLDLAKSGSVVLSEKVMVEAIRGGVILGCSALAYKGFEILSERYKEFSIEGNGNSKSVVVKGRRF